MFCESVDGVMIGYMFEENTFGRMFARQILESHRGFTVTLFDAENNPLLSFERFFF